MADAAKVKADVSGIADSAEKATERVSKSVKNILTDTEAEIEAYRKSVTISEGRVATDGKNEYIRSLNEDLKLGIITAKEYEAELRRIGQLNASDGSPKTNTPSSQSGFSSSYKRMAAEGLQIYKELDPATQKLILRNIELREELSQVSEAQKELNEAFADGVIAGPKLSQAQAALAAKELDLKNSIKETTAELKKQADQAALATQGVQDSGKAGYEKLGNSISKPVGQLSRLQYAAKAYENMAASSYNPEIIAKYNRKLQETEEQISKTKNMGKEGFDEMGNAVEDNSVSIGDVYGKAKEFADILPGIGLAGILAFASGPILEYIDSLNLFIAEATEAEIIAEKVGQALNSPNYSAAVKNVSELKLNIGLAKEGLLDKTKVLHQYNESIGKTTGQVKSLNEAELALNKNADAYIKVTLLKAAAQLALEDAAKESYAAEQARQNGEADNGLKNKNLSVYDKLKAAFVQDVSYEKKLIGERTTEAVKASEDEADAKEEIAKKFQKRAAEISKKYKFDFFGGTEDGKKATDNTQSILNERQGLLNRMADINAEFARKSKTKDQEEIDAVKDKFQSIRREIEAFNLKNPKKAISLVDLNNNETQALTDLQAQQAVDRTQIQIEAQKQIFDQFEQYKLDSGVRKAQERFGAELKGFKSYIDYLKSLIPDATDTTAGANAMRDYLAKLIPAAEKEQSQKTFDNTTKQLKRILEATETAALKKIEIEKKYNADVLALRNDTTISDVERQARIKKLQETRLIELKSTQQLAFEETQYYKTAMKDVTNATLAELKLRLKEARKELANANLTPEERAAMQGKLKAAETSLGDKGFKEDQYGQLINQNSKTTKQAETIANYAKAASGSFYEMAGALADIAPGAAATMETLGDLAGVAGDAAGSVASFASGDIVGGVTKAVSAVAGVFNIASKARESARKAAEELRTFQDKIFQGEIALNVEMRARARTQKDINDLTSIELAARKQLLATQADQAKVDFDKQLALVQSGQYYNGDNKTEKYGGVFGIGKKTRVIYGTSGLQGQNFDQLEALSIAGKLDEATEKLFQDLKKSKAEMDAIGESAEDLASIITDKLTGGLTADSISGTIVQGFKEGKRAVLDFADDAQEIVQNALLSALAYNMLSEPLKKLVAQFGEDAQDGYTNEELDKFKTGLGTATDTFLKAAEAVEQTTGIKLSSGSANASAATGELKKVLTEDSVNVYIGIARGTYDLQKQTLTIIKGNPQIFRDQLLSLKAIETNTGRIAVNTDSLPGKLDQIIINTKPERSRD